MLQFFHLANIETFLLDKDYLVHFFVFVALIDTLIVRKYMKKDVKSIDQSVCPKEKTSNAVAFNSSVVPQLTRLNF